MSRHESIDELLAGSGLEGFRRPPHEVQQLRQAAAAADPLTTQVGGGHYKDLAIQPVEYILANGLGFIEGAVVKYVSRWKQKGGVQDLKKARHFLDILIAKQENP